MTIAFLNVIPSLVHLSYPGRILLIDDDPDIIDLYGEFLTDAGYKVEVARNGEEGIKKIRSGGYDLIILDIMMPKIDGISILRDLKEHPTGPEIYNGPIIVLSNLDQNYVIKTAMSLGAKGYLIKSG